jgi:hypothetical protein
MGDLHRYQELVTRSLETPTGAADIADVKPERS